MVIKINNKIYPIYQATNFFTRLKGLMFQKNINYGILFPRCNSIHTFFMFSPIDIIILDQDNKILAIYQNIVPNRIIHYRHSIKKTSILELPPNTSLNFHPGDIITFQ